MLLRIIMGMDVNIESNIDAVEKFFGSFDYDIGDNAARKAINRTMVSVRKVAVKRLKQVINLPAAKIKKYNTVIKKPRGGNIYTFEGYIGFTRRPIPLINFVVGNKDRIKLKGVKIKKRRKIKIHIYKTNKHPIPGAFIQKVRSKQVFRQDTGGGFRKQSAPSIAEIMEQRNMKAGLLRYAQKKFKKEFFSQYQYRYAKKQMGVNKAPLKT